MSRYFLNDRKNVLVLLEDDGTLTELPEVLNDSAQIISPEVAVVDLPEKPRRGRRKKNFETEEKPKTRCCKLCGKPGHRRDGCPNLKETGLYKKQEMDRETKAQLEGEDPEVQELVWDIRSKFVVQEMPPLKVCNELNIDMPRFLELCKKYNIHR